YKSGSGLELVCDTLISAPQMKAARALLGLDQRALAEAAGLSLPTIQRMEGSGGQVRGNVESLVRVVDALDRLGIELIGEGAASDDGGRDVRLKNPAERKETPGCRFRRRWRWPSGPSCWHWYPPRRRSAPAVGRVSCVRYRFRCSSLPAWRRSPPGLPRLPAARWSPRPFRSVCPGCRGGCESMHWPAFSCA